MKRILSIAASLFLAMNVSAADVVKLTVQNPLSTIRNGEMAEVAVAPIIKKLDGAKQFIVTDADGDIRLITPNFRKSYAVQPITTVSTIGAGDNFNAGIIYGLIQYGICRSDILSLSEDKWQKVIQCGQDLATEVCQSLENSISVEFAEKYRCLFEEKK